MRAAVAATNRPGVFLHPRSGRGEDAPCSPLDSVLVTAISFRRTRKRLAGRGPPTVLHAVGEGDLAAVAAGEDLGSSVHAIERVSEVRSDGLHSTVCRNRNAQTRAALNDPPGSATRACRTACAPSSQRLSVLQGPPMSIVVGVVMNRHAAAVDEHAFLRAAQRDSVPNAPVAARARRGAARHRGESLQRRRACAEAHRPGCCPAGNGSAFRRGGTRIVPLVRSGGRRSM